MTLNTPKKGSIWYHFKHDSSKGINHMAYEILGVAINTSTDEMMLAYKALYDVKDSNHEDLGEDFYVRPVGEWEESKDFNGQKVSRFRLATDLETQEILKLRAG
jgi:hypothetical protein